MLPKQVTVWHPCCLSDSGPSGTQVSEKATAREVDVLKITITETATDRRWILQGRLVGPWVSELRSAWKRAHTSQDKRACVLDLNDVTFIDKNGERLLRAISKKGAQLIANGIYTKHVLGRVLTNGKRGTMPVEVMDVIGGEDAASSSADRTARMEDQ